jgi:TRAP-type mannitol/chloroaromatic compound transport system permease large subunit
MVPPLVLIVLVLGSIFAGVATPTEAGAIGSVGTLGLAAVSGRLSLAALRGTMRGTLRLSSMVMFLLVGSTAFILVFRGLSGDLWIEGLLTNLPGGLIGLLIVGNLAIFILGFFIDFFEIAFIVIPLLLPVAEKMLPALMPGMPIDVVMVWFGVILAMNLQTSFLTPPFGFALFYLRSVAPKEDYADRVTGEKIKAVTTGQIYKGSVAFIVLQLIMLASVIAFPQLVTGGIVQGEKIDADKALREMVMPGAPGLPAPSGMEMPTAPRLNSPSAGQDAMRALRESIREDKADAAAEAAEKKK